MERDQSGGIRFLPDRPGGPIGTILASLSPEAHSAVVASSEIRKLATGEILVQRGVYPTEIGCVLSGALGMVQFRADGKRHIVGLLTANDICGRLFDGPNDFQIEALAPTDVYLFNRDFFETLLRDEPAAEILFLNELRGEIDAAREWLMLIRGRQVLHRVAGFLSLLARRTQVRHKRGVATVKLPLSRANLAQLLNTSPESLSRTFQKIANMGKIRIVQINNFEIVDIVGLEAIAKLDAALIDLLPPPAQRTEGRRQE